MVKPAQLVASLETKLSIEKLFDYYKPDEIHSYCQRCPKYGRFWSCPPHNFNIPEYLKQYTFITIIANRIYLEPELSKEEQIACYHHTRKKTNNKLLRRLEKLNDCEILISGHCWLCKTCMRTNSEQCISPEKLKYSLESLGFKISDIINNEFNDSLQWKHDENLKYLYSVQAILSK